MRQTLVLVNKLKTSGLIVDYAIGGGTGALFYTEALSTYDLDLFIILKSLSSPLIDLSPIYNYLESAGGYWSGEHIVVAGEPLQFIVADQLGTEAINRAKSIRFEGIRTKVLSPEYLIALALRAGRTKDRIRIGLLRAKTDELTLSKVLRDYDLWGKYQGWFPET